MKVTLNNIKNQEKKLPRLIIDKVGTIFFIKKCSCVRYSGIHTSFCSIAGSEPLQTNFCGDYPGECGDYEDFMGNIQLENE